MQFKEYTCDLIEHFFLKRTTKIWWLRSDSTIARNDHRYNNVQSPARCPESNGSRNDREEKLQVHDRKARKEVKRSWEKKRSRSCVRACVCTCVVSWRKRVGITPEEFSRGLSRRGYYACLNVPRIRVRLPTRGDRPFNIAGIRLIYECPGYI